MQGTPGIRARLTAAPLHLRLLFGFALVLALCAAQSVFAYRTAADHVDADRIQRHNEDTANLANEARTALIQMDASYRAYVLSSDKRLLASYNAAGLVFNTDVQELQVLSTAEPDLERWKTLEQRVALWQNITGLSQENLQEFDAIQGLLDEAIAVEQGNLELSTAVTADASNRFSAVLLWGTLGVFGVGVIVAGLSARNMARAIVHVQAGERRYRQMFENNPAIKLLIDSKSGAIVEANQAACDFYGYARAVLQQMNIAVITLDPDAVAENMHRVVARVRSSRSASGPRRSCARVRSGSASSTRAFRSPHARGCR